MPPLQVYTRRSHPSTNNNDISLPNAGTSSDSPPVPSSPTSVMPSTTEATPPLALRKGIRSSRNPHPIYNFVSYHRLSPSYYTFVSVVSAVSIPKTVREALDHPGWCNAMVEEMTALHNNGTWELVSLPPGKSTVGCRWVYTVKVGPDGKINRLKARLVAKGYTDFWA
ncbi:uncharacterized mitochondrial protein AtMg00820-like [Manihot esculenta]|uniref:uncharacterized mitochondrial protein AtMg00820-like n=1 Tax=Manihot esculenta TaxID=3983 RepID=UPI001CC3B306|nr:uncharacterized mitochondrial protein AtMg00820-like [Manihot esculenta]